MFVQGRGALEVGGVRRIFYWGTRCSWLRTYLEYGPVGGDRERVECRCGRSAFEGELGLELAGSGVRGRVEFGGEEEEEGGDGEGVHYGWMVDW